MKPKFKNYLVIQWEHGKLVATQCKKRKYKIEIFRDEVALNLTTVTTGDIAVLLNTAQDYLNRYGRKVEY